MVPEARFLDGGAAMNRVSVAASRQSAALFSGSQQRRPSAETPLRRGSRLQNAPGLLVRDPVWPGKSVETGGLLASDPGVAVWQPGPQRQRAAAHTLADVTRPCHEVRLGRRDS
jgi:hypothetical protein